MRRGMMLRFLPVLTATLLSRPGAAQAPADIPLTIENHQFQPEEIRVKAGTSFVLIITNKDTTAEEFDSQDLRLEKVIPGGKSLRVRMPALKAGAYHFIGEFHEATAKGHIIAE
jgi:plastocyanin